MVANAPKPGIVRRLLGRIGLSTTRPDAEELAKRPDIGEQSRGQQNRGFGGLFGSMGGAGFGVPLGGTFNTYRLMRRNPTIALARAIARAPLKAAEWTYQKRDDDVPDEWVSFIKGALNPLRRSFISDTLRALDNGFQAFEKVFEIRKGRLTYQKLKPLLPDNTQPLIDEQTGQFRGARNFGVTLPCEKVFWFANDSEAGNFFGEPRSENVRSEWSAWEVTLAKMGRYVERSSGAIPMVEYPIGDSQDENGDEQSNFDIATKVLSSLGQGLGVTMPKELAAWSAPFVEAGVNPEALMAWRISFLETKTSRVKDFLEPLRHLERLMMRGWLVPERTATEGQFGTKADAETGADVVLLISEDLLADIIDCVNWYLTDQLLVLNFGAEARGAVFVDPAPLSTEKKAFFRNLIEKVISSQVGPELFTQLFDELAIIEGAGAPPQKDEAIRRGLVGAAVAEESNLLNRMRGIMDGGGNNGGVE